MEHFVIENKISLPIADRKKSEGEEWAVGKRYRT